MRLLVLSALCVVVAGGVAFAATGTPKQAKPVDIRKEMDEKCGPAPYGLVDLNGKTATKEEMEEAKFQVTSFITQVDVFQECLDKLRIALGERMTPNDVRLVQLAIDQSQSEKEAVGAAFNNAVCEYNHMHGIPDKECKDGKLIKATVVEQAPQQPAGAKPAPAKPAPAKAATPTTTSPPPSKPKTTP